jgi:hypothetical protein
LSSKDAGRNEIGLGVENCGYRTSSISVNNIERGSALSTELERYVLVNTLFCPPPAPAGTPVGERIDADSATVRLVIVAVVAQINTRFNLFHTSPFVVTNQRPCDSQHALCGSIPVSFEDMMDLKRDMI